MGVGGSRSEQETIGCVDRAERLAMSVFDWKQGVRYRQGLDGHSYVGAYSHDAVLKAFRPIATDAEHQRWRTFVSARLQAM